MTMLDRKQMNCPLKQVRCLVHMCVYVCVIESPCPHIAFDTFWTFFYVYR